MPDPGTPTRRWRNRLVQPFPSMKPAWTRELARSLRNGRLSPVCARHLDELLLWLSNPDHLRAAELERAIGQQGLSRAQARAAAFCLLDQHLFDRPDRPPAQTLGLEAGVDLGLAKQRYRRLIQVYHPDRHPERADWATRRTEQINRAWTALQRGSGSSETGLRPASRRAADHSPPQQHRPSLGLMDWISEITLPIWSHLQGRIRGRSLFERRLSLTIALIALMILAGLLWPREHPKPIPRIIHHPIGTEASRIISLKEPAPPPAEQPPQPPAQRGTRGSHPPPIMAAAKPPTAPAVPPTQEIQDRPEIRRDTSQPPIADRSAEPPPAPGPATMPALPLPPQDQPPIPTWDWPLLTDTHKRPALAMVPGPEPPSAPLIPAPPLPEAGPIPQAATVPPADGCQTAWQLLERFKNAYQDGALDQLMALYSPLARENDLAGWFAIRQTYETWFRITVRRQIDFDQIQIQPLPERQGCTLRARYQAAYLDQQARIVTQSGELDLLLEAKGPEWLILRARY
ncbi:J domain-containing protein [Caldichromatium japonicum]|uniref:J domain-containing protein n=1 Tax=Caldichromatium japonicum TaxID=2699430 RepID=A0A6G7VDR1_9GAMM|nr:J domain-containing protein [Caldichromatium japonicum]QIK38092.1 J domain-containing protein [Caldichromatium japonicum]